uniref:Uncharacterized protein n=1 Tax=Glossina palpalis gambiensis TaxID=67801 RepID=A0A1B0BG02_9MUSC
MLLVIVCYYLVTTFVGRNFNTFSLLLLGKGFSSRLTCRSLGFSNLKRNLRSRSSSVSPSTVSESSSIFFRDLSRFTTTGLSLGFSKEKRRFNSLSSSSPLGDFVVAFDVAAVVVVVLEDAGLAAESLAWGIDFTGGGGSSSDSSDSSLSSTSSESSSSSVSSSVSSSSSEDDGLGSFLGVDVALLVAIFVAVVLLVLVLLGSDVFFETELSVTLLGALVVGLLDVTVFSFSSLVLRAHGTVVFAVGLRPVEPSSFTQGGLDVVRLAAALAVDFGATKGILVFNSLLRIYLFTLKHNCKVF